MKPPLVLIPGFMQDARAFLPLLVHLGRDHPVTLLPLGADTVEQISAAALPCLPEGAVLVGHGLGGAVAIDILRRAPERVSRIALISTDPLPEPSYTAAAREPRLILSRTGRLAEAITADLPPGALAPTDWRDEVLALVQDMAAGLGPDVYLTQTRAAQRRPDQQRTLHKVKIPALILAGRQDGLVPLRRQQVLAGLMPFGKLQIIEDAGHLPQLEQPEAVSDAIRAFLGGPMLLR